MSNSGGQPGALIDTSTNPVASTLTGVFAELAAFNTNNNNWARLLVAHGPVDAEVANNILANAPWVFNGTTWDRQRTPAVFKAAAPTAAGDTAIWTPTAGKKFRLMGFLLSLSNNAAQAVAGVDTMQFRDATTGMNLVINPFVPGAAGALVGSQVWSVPTLGNGILSAAANNVLNFNLATALTVGNIQVCAWGTEE